VDRHRPKREISLGWPERLLAGVAAVLLVLLGLAFGVVLLGLAAIAAAALAGRIWWLRRKLRSEKARGEGELIEAEYRVVERRRGPP
jgi:hypothetical protein